MNFWSFLALASAFQFPSASAYTTTPNPAMQLRVLSFNIRYAATSPFTNEKPWAERYPLVLTQLHHETRFLDGTAADARPAAAILCLQEVLHAQLVDIMNGLNKLPSSSNSSKTPADGPIWAHVGVGRDDGKTKGEYSPVIYPVNIFRLVHSETVWMSPTPDTPGLGWDASSIRILTVAVLEYKSTGQRVLASATHLDNSGVVSRNNSVGLILDTLKRVHNEWAIDDVLPIVLAGDFNSPPDQEAYLRMAASDYMYDSYDFVEPKSRYGEENTYTSFEPEKNKDEQGRIDFIWLGPKDSVCSGSQDANSKNCSSIVDGYAGLPNVFEDGVFLSDHRCVVGDVRLQY